jgi:ubiquinone/menaquinone biosynthesis C-methylase UbiE
MNENNFNTKKSTSEKDVIEFYENYAESWDSRFNNAFSDQYFHKSRWSIFSKVIEKFQLTNTDALELGVGTGVYIDKSSRLFKQITAVDGSKNMLNKLNEKLKNQNITNVETVLSDVIDLKNVKSESVNVVYFFGLIEHIINMKGFVNEIYRVLKPGGYVIGVTPNGLSPWYKLRKLLRGTGMHCSTDTYYTLPQLKSVFSVNNIEIVDNIYWGGVPAGINNKSFTYLLRFVEKAVVAFNLKQVLGGITFVGKK